MKKRYHNIFDYYPGPNESDKALENNVTKALINVLELCDGAMRRAFVTWLADEIKVDLQPTAKIKCITFPRRRDLDSDLGTAKMKVMLGIKPYWAGEASRRRRSLPKEPWYDGALVGQGWLIAIESKVNEGINADQIEDERCHLGPGAVKKEITWKQIHDFFLGQLKGSHDRVSRFLSKQFCEYLDMIDQVGFRGFKREYFPCIKTNGTWIKDKDDTRDELRRVMYALASDVRESLKPLYPEISDPRGLKRRKEYDYAWVSFYPRHSGADKWAHQCIRLDLQRGTLHVKAEVRSREAFRRLRGHLYSQQGKRKLVSVLGKVQSQCSSVWFSLYRNKGNGWEELYGDEIDAKTYPKTLEKHVRDLSSTIANYPGHKPLLKFELGKTFPKDKVCNAAGDSLVKEIADVMEALDLFVRFVNGR